MIANTHVFVVAAEKPQGVVEQLARVVKVGARLEVSGHEVSQRVELDLLQVKTLVDLQGGAHGSWKKKRKYKLTEMLSFYSPLHQELKTRRSPKSRSA